MIRIVFWVCLISSPHQCEEEAVLREGITLGQCQGPPGQYAVIEWLNEHDRYRLLASKGWRCEPAQQKDI
jgi:hypothetical protein